MHLVVTLVVKSLPASAGDARDPGSIPESQRSLGVGKGNPFQFLPGKSHGQRSLLGSSPWSHKESDTTEQTFSGVCVVASYIAAAILLCLWYFL